MCAFVCRWRKAMHEDVRRWLTECVHANSVCTSHLSSPCMLIKGWMEHEYGAAALCAKVLRNRRCVQSATCSGTPAHGSHNKRFTSMSKQKQTAVTWSQFSKTLPKTSCFPRRTFSVKKNKTTQTMVHSYCSAYLPLFSDINVSPSTCTIM